MAEMNQEMREKYRRLNDRLRELNDLETKIGKLAFYLNENKVTGFQSTTMRDQLSAMQDYACCLRKRVINGMY